MKSPMTSLEKVMGPCMRSTKLTSPAGTRETDGGLLAGGQAGRDRFRGQVQAQPIVLGHLPPGELLLLEGVQALLTAETAIRRAPMPKGVPRPPRTGPSARSAGTAHRRPPHRAPRRPASPSQCRSRTMLSSCSRRERLRSVSSMRNTIVPPRCRANRKLYRAVRALPTWRVPVGLGANLTRTLLMKLLDRRVRAGTGS